MAINKNFTVSAGIDVAAGANVGTTLAVGSNTSVGGNLSVNGAAVFGNTVVISGNLTVSGTTTYVNTATMNIADNIMTLNADVTGAPSENAGIEINRGTSANVSLIWNEATDKWSITNDGVTFGDIHSKLTDVVLGTDTSGNYVAAVGTGTPAITIGGTPGEGWTPTVAIRSANTTVDGIVKLTDEVSNTSVSIGASATAVKTAYDAAINANTNAASAYTNAVTYSSNATNITNGTLNTARLPATVNVASAINVGANVNLTTAAINVGNSTVNTTITALNIGGVSNAQLNIVNATTFSATTNLAVGANVSVTTSQLTIGNSTVNTSVNSTMFSGISNNSNYLGGQLPAYYTNATNITTGTLPYAQIPANVTNTTAGFTISGAWTFGANVTMGVGKHVVLSSTSGISANNTYGAAGQSLFSNGTAVYWATPFSGVTNVDSGNGLTGGPITTAGTLSVVAANGVSVTASGVNVLAGNSQLISNTTGLWVNQSAINHNGLSNFDSNKHIDHTTVSIIAGNGIGGGGDISSSRTLSIVANSGIVANSSGTFVNSNNGLVSNSTGVFVVPGTGIVANATGVHVNSSYIATVSSNNSTFLGGYTWAAPPAIGGTVANTVSASSLTVAGGITANGSLGSAGQIMTSNGTTVYWNDNPQSTYIKLSAEQTSNTGSTVISGLSFAPAASTTYEIEAVLLVKMFDTSNNWYLGIDVPSGMSSGALSLSYADADGTNRLTTAQALTSANTLVTVRGTTTYRVATWKGVVTVGSSPSGNIQFRHGPQAPGSNSWIGDGSFVRYRVI